MAIPNRNINYPTAIKYGAGRIRELAEFCKAGKNRPKLNAPPQTEPSRADDPVRRSKPRADDKFDLPPPG